MFIGEYSHNLDDKGRLAVPKKFRAVLEQGIVVTRGLDRCLFVYTLTEWKDIAGKLSSLPFSQSNSRAFSRLMLAGAMDLSVDKQGRVSIPEYLRTYAGLEKEVIVAGLYNRLEIWDSNAWREYTQRTEKESNDIAEQMSELGV
jgi:MraZ protein